MSTSTNRDRATFLLRNYIRVPWERAGQTWTAEHDTEIEQLVDALNGMVIDEIQKHAEDAPHLYPDGSAS